MSRRNTYLLGGVAAVAGIAMLVFAIAALTSGDDESTSPNRGAGEQTATQTPSRPSGATGSGANNAPSEPSGTKRSGRGDSPRSRSSQAGAGTRLLGRDPPGRIDTTAAEGPVRPCRQGRETRHVETAGHAGRPVFLFLPVRAVPGRHAPGGDDVDAMGAAGSAVRRRQREGRAGLRRGPAPPSSARPRGSSRSRRARTSGSCRRPTPMRSRRWWRGSWAMPSDARRSRRAHARPPASSRGRRSPTLRRRRTAGLCRRERGQAGADPGVPPLSLPCAAVRQPREALR